MKTNWKKSDIIKFCGEEYEVLENYGHTGKVRHVEEETTCNSFYWEYLGEKCELVRSA